MEQLSPHPFDEVGAVDGASQRHEVRDSLFLTANLRMEGMREMLQVRVRNLSAGGLMAEVPDHIAQGTPVELELRGVGRVCGRVAWYAAGRIGIAFDRMIDPHLARKPVGGGAKTPSYVKPILPIR